MSAGTSVRAGAGCVGSVDALQRHLAYVCNRATNKDAARAALRKHVEEEARELGVEAFSRFMDQLYDCIAVLIESNNVSENLGALHTVMVLIDVQFGESASKISKLSTYIRNVFETKSDPEIPMLVSTTLGCIARTDGSLTADEVERQVKTALEWLGGDRVEYRRFAAVLILRVSSHTPGSFPITVLQGCLKFGSVSRLGHSLSST